MRIAVIADTHDKLPLHVLTAVRGADEIWHLGDITTHAVLDSLRDTQRPLRFVRGNCDFDESWPLSLDFEIEGSRIHLIHIPPKQAPASVDLLFHGHTHVPRNELVGRTRFFNPGCITRPNRGAPASYAWLELQRGRPADWMLVKV